jgi:EKC/KEOPS complex subunit CGI121/TPRKB
LSQNHLLTATFLALHAILTSRSKTRTPHSELVFRLSPNNNIGESYKKFGLSDTTSSLIAVKLPLRPSSASSSDEAGKEWTLDESITNESVSKHLGDVVKGTSVKIGERGEELGECCDEEKVKKVYKLGGGGIKGKKGAMNGDAGIDQRKDLESVILGTMTLKGS